MFTTHPVVVANEEERTMQFEIVGDTLPDDAKRAGRGGQLDQAAAFMREHPGQFVKIDTKPNENAARNLAQALDKGDRNAFKIDEDGPYKGGRYEGAYRPDGTVLGRFLPLGWEDDEADEADQV